MGKKHSSHVIEYRTDPNLVNQIAALTNELKKQQKQNETFIHDLQARLQSLEEEGVASAQEVEHYKKLLDEAKKKEAARLEELEKLKNYPPARFQLTDFWKRSNTLHIGVVGGAGTGKSTFINTVRGMRRSDPGAASINHGVECTMEETPYSQEFMHDGKIMHVVWWDLPGGGTDKFPWKTYLRDFGIRYFNFVIQFTVTRYTEGDTFLMREMDEHNVPHATVRNKIDEAIRSAKMEGDDVNVMMSEIRHDFSSRGVERVFLISSPLKYRSKHDFPSLCKYISTNTKIRIDEGIDFSTEMSKRLRRSLKWTFMDPMEGAEEVEGYNLFPPGTQPPNTVVFEKFFSPLLTIGEINFFGASDSQSANIIMASSVLGLVGIRYAYTSVPNVTLLDLSNANRSKIAPYGIKQKTTYFLRKILRMH